MKIALIGYGKMGKEIEQIARSRGHEIVLTIDQENQDDLNSDNLKEVAVAIEFTTPQTAYQNYLTCFENGIPVVSGTTGWLDKLDKITQMCQKDAAFFYASNFSLGVNLFFELNKKLAQLMSNHTDYTVHTEEIHHTQKLDAPSGTSITVAEGIINEITRFERWKNDACVATNELPIISKREGSTPGTHTVTYDSEIDKIEITHEAKGRKGFALGAVLAAEFMADKKQGFFGMNDLLNF